MIRLKSTIVVTAVNDMNISLKVLLYTLRTIIISFYIFLILFLAISPYTLQHPLYILIYPFLLVPVVAIGAAYKFLPIAIIEIVTLFCVGFTFYIIQKDKKMEKEIFQNTTRYILINIALIAFFVAMMFFALAIAPSRGILI